MAESWPVAPASASDPSSLPSGATATAYTHLRVANVFGLTTSSRADSLRLTAVSASLVKCSSRTAG
jgi:hypothetical protein